jgi:hypothetical protein
MIKGYFRLGYSHGRWWWKLGSLYQFSPGNPYTTQKDISDRDIVMDGGRDRYIDSHHKTITLT